MLTAAWVPSPTGYAPLDLLIGLAAGVVALGTLWRYLIRPAWRGLRKLTHVVEDIVPALDHLADVSPTLLGIASEFSANHGSSLRDVVDRIEQSGGKTAEQLAALSEYTHRSHHQTRQDLMVLGGRAENFEIRLTDLAETVKEQGDLRDLLARWAPIPPTPNPPEKP